MQEDLRKLEDRLERLRAFEKSLPPRSEEVPTVGDTRFESDLRRMDREAYDKYVELKTKQGELTERLAGIRDGAVTRDDLSAAREETVRYKSLKAKLDVHEGLLNKAREKRDSLEAQLKKLKVRTFSSADKVKKKYLLEQELYEVNDGISRLEQEKRDIEQELEDFMPSDIEEDAVRDEEIKVAQELVNVTRDMLEIASGADRKRDDIEAEIENLEGRIRGLESFVSALPERVLNVDYAVLESAIGTAGYQLEEAREERRRLEASSPELDDPDAEKKRALSGLDEEINSLETAASMLTEIDSAASAAGDEYRSEYREDIDSLMEDAEMATEIDDQLKRKFGRKKYPASERQINMLIEALEKLNMLYLFAERNPEEKKALAARMDKVLERLVYFLERHVRHLKKTKGIMDAAEFVEGLLANEKIKKACENASGNDSFAAREGVIEIVRGIGLKKAKRLMKKGQHKAAYETVLTLYRHINESGATPDAAVVRALARARRSVVQSEEEKRKKLTEDEKADSHETVRNPALEREIARGNVYKITKGKDDESVTPYTYDVARASRASETLALSVMNEKPEGLVDEKGVLARLGRIRGPDSEVLEEAFKKLTSGIPEAQKKEMAAEKDALLDTARNTDILVVRNRYTLHDKGPLSHAVVGEARKDDTAIWLGEKTLTNTEITDEELAMLLIDEARHIKYPKRDHGTGEDAIEHDRATFDRLSTTAQDAGEAAPGEACMRDMARTAEDILNEVIENLPYYAERLYWLNEKLFELYEKLAASAADGKLPLHSSGWGEYQLTRDELRNLENRLAGAIAEKNTNKVFDRLKKAMVDERVEDVVWILSLFGRYKNLLRSAEENYDFVIRAEKVLIDVVQNKIKGTRAVIKPNELIKKPLRILAKLEPHVGKHNIIRSVFDAARETFRVGLAETVKRAKAQEMGLLTEQIRTWLKDCEDEYPALQQFIRQCQKTTEQALRERIEKIEKGLPIRKTLIVIGVIGAIITLVVLVLQSGVFGLLGETKPAADSLPNVRNAGLMLLGVGLAISALFRTIREWFTTDAQEGVGNPYKSPRARLDEPVRELEIMEEKTRRNDVIFVAALIGIPVLGIVVPELFSLLFELLGISQPSTAVGISQIALLSAIAIPMAGADRIPESAAREVTQVIDMANEGVLREGQTVTVRFGDESYALTSEDGHDVLKALANVAPERVSDAVGEAVRADSELRVRGTLPYEVKYVVRQDGSVEFSKKGEIVFDTYGSLQHFSSTKLVRASDRDDILAEGHNHPHEASDPSEYLGDQVAMARTAEIYGVPVSQVNPMFIHERGPDGKIAVTKRLRVDDKNFVLETLDRLDNVTKSVKLLPVSAASIALAEEHVADAVRIRPLAYGTGETVTAAEITVEHRIEKEASSAKDVPEIGIKEKLIVPMTVPPPLTASSLLPFSRDTRSEADTMESMLDELEEKAGPLTATRKLILAFDESALGPSVERLARSDKVQVVIIGTPGAAERAGVATAIEVSKEGQAPLSARIRQKAEGKGIKPANIAILLQRNASQEQADEICHDVNTNKQRDTSYVWIADEAQAGSIAEIGLAASLMNLNNAVRKSPCLVLVGEAIDSGLIESIKFKLRGILILVERVSETLSRILDCIREISSSV
jgi:hypothetical protein